MGILVFLITCENRRLLENVCSHSSVRMSGLIAALRWLGWLVGWFVGGGSGEIQFGRKGFIRMERVWVASWADGGERTKSAVAAKRARSPLFLSR